MPKKLPQTAVGRDPSRDPGYKDYPDVAGEPQKSFSSSACKGYRSLHRDRVCKADRAETTGLMTDSYEYSGLVL